MSIVIYYHCDRRIPYGTCASISQPGATVEAALKLAEAAGWYITPERALCPDCAGPKRLTPKPGRLTATSATVTPIRGGAS